MSVLSELLAAESGWEFRPKVTEPLMLRRTVAGLEGELADVRDHEDTAAIQLRAAEAASDGVLTTLKRRELREACRAFLSPPHPPGRDPLVGAAVISAVEQLRRRAALNALIDAYLDEFQVDDADVERFGTLLNDLATRWEWREGDVWPERASRFRLFDTGRAPTEIAKAVLTSSEPVAVVLDAAGLGSDLRQTGGLASAAFGSACRDVARLRGPTAVPRQMRAIEWATVARTALAYPSAWPDYAGSLFLPWLRDEPSPEHRNVLIDAAVSWAKDPRVQPARWRPVRDAGAAYDVIVRWLTKASVEQFFEIVSETMRDRPDMWRDRRAFWTRYLKADLIDAAWVAFCADGAARAELAARRTGDSSLGMFGRCSTGNGKGAEHAALIMKLGDVTVVDWSHNGSWNIWPRGAPGAPELFKHNTRRFMDYAPHELMNAPLRGSHDASGNWRWRVEDLIRQETGRRP